MTIVADRNSVASGTASQPEPPPQLPNVDDAQQFYLFGMGTTSTWSYQYVKPRPLYYVIPGGHEIVLRKAAEELTRLRDLRPGWDGRRAQAITAEAVYGAALVLNRVLSDRAELPQFFPLSDGGIQIEWLAADEIEIEVDRTGKAHVLATAENGKILLEGSFDPQASSELAYATVSLVGVISDQVIMARQA